MRLISLSLCLALAASAQQPIPGIERLEPAAKADPLLRAAIEELARARNLRTLGEAIYYAEVSFDDAASFSTSASLGAALAPAASRLRPLRIAVRVGGANFDNTNSIFSDFFSGTRLDSDSLPLDNDPLALRHAFWLSFDRAYKTASEALGRKAAAVRGITTPDPLPDFWDAPPRILIEEPRRTPIDEAAWTRRVKSLSALFSAYPAITSSSVDFESSQGTLYVLNTRGTVLRTPDRIAIFRVRAGRQAPDGMPLYDGASVLSLDPARFPAEAELARTVQDVASNLNNLAQAPQGDAYVGPVLFSGAAAAQVFAEVLGTHFAASRRPISDPGRALPFPISDFDGRIGSRVLPEWLSVTDDPTLRELSGTPLIGHYEADLEGVFPARLPLVENGVLKALLTTRQPVRGMTGPNGRARLPGAFGLKTARPSNLLVEARQTESEDRLKQRLLELVRTQGKPYGILVRKMDFPSFSPLDEFRRIAMRSARSGAGARPVSSPVLLYRVYPDGREELVRGLRFRSLNTRAFRDILAAGDRQHLFHYLDNGAPMAINGGGNYIVGCSVAAPSVLFEDLELEPANDDLPKPPVVPPPPLSSSK
jgi:hypothetical protein